MVTVAILHPDFEYKGGGEAVCLHTVKAVQERYSSANIRIYAKSKPNLRELANYFGINLDLQKVELVTISKVWPQTISSNLQLLQKALYHRKIHQEMQEDLDLVISTQNEFTVQIPSAQYIHTPRPPFIPQPSGPIERIYSKLCKEISGFEKMSKTPTHLIANSEYTAKKVRQIYEKEPSVVYPPVDCSKVDDIPWDQKENGFVVVGRISPVKRTLQAIKTIQAVVNEGYDTHLHVIGPEGDSKYTQRVVEKAEKLNYVHLEGELNHSNRNYQEMIQEHRYAISHCVESFGISIAEAAAAGTLPFVVNEGGQTEIIQSEELIFSDDHVAIEKISTVLDNEQLQKRLHDRLPDVKKRFGRSRFKTELQKMLPKDKTI